MIRKLIFFSYIYPGEGDKWWRKKSLAANLMAFSGVMRSILTADPRYIPKYPSALYVFLKQSTMELYILDPSGATTWFWSLVLTKSNGKTQDTPMIPAIPPLIIFGRSLKKIKTIFLLIKKKKRKPIVWFCWMLQQAKDWFLSLFQDPLTIVVN